MRKTLIPMVMVMLSVAIAVTFAGPDYTPGSRAGGAVQLSVVGSGTALVISNTVGSVELLRSLVCTATVENASSEGQYLLIVNMAATNIMFADSGNLELSGATTLNQYDTLYLYSAETNTWVEVSQADN